MRAYKSWCLRVERVVFSLSAAYEETNWDDSLENLYSSSDLSQIRWEREGLDKSGWELTRTASIDKHFAHFAQVAKRLQQKQFFLELLSPGRSHWTDQPRSQRLSSSRLHVRDAGSEVVDELLPLGSNHSLNLYFVFSADTSVQLKAIWTWLSFFCCSLGLTSTLETKTTLLHFSVRCSNCFQLLSHTRLFRAENLPGRSAENSSLVVCYCIGL